MQYAIAGWPVAGCPSESLLERITRKLRDGWKPLLLAMKRCFVRPSTLIKNGY
ncbi:protease FtsH-inhibitory lysogeny factor CIII [Escherichia coli]|nr:protease FtsH-inhibitory lysogeny factor CIII [Escherichia coli]KAA2141201.1 protease FtsH-inhibitory lysogeny factor CIII [Escherichia coli]